MSDGKPDTKIKVNYCEPDTGVLPISMGAGGVWEGLRISIDAGAEALVINLAYCITVDIPYDLLIDKLMREALDESGDWREFARKRSEAKHE